VPFLRFASSSFTSLVYHIRSSSSRLRFSESVCSSSAPFLLAYAVCVSPLSFSLRLSAFLPPLLLHLALIDYVPSSLVPSVSTLLPTFVVPLPCCSFCPASPQHRASCCLRSSLHLCSFSCVRLSPVCIVPAFARPPSVLCFSSSLACSPCSSSCPPLSSPLPIQPVHSFLWVRFLWVPRSDVKPLRLGVVSLITLKNHSCFYNCEICKKNIGHAVALPIC